MSDPLRKGSCVNKTKWVGNYGAKGVLAQVNRGCVLPVDVRGSLVCCVGLPTRGLERCLACGCPPSSRQRGPHIVAAPSKRGGGMSPGKLSLQIWAAAIWPPCAISLHIMLCMFSVCSAQLKPTASSHLSIYLGHTWSEVAKGKLMLFAYFHQGISMTVADMWMLQAGF